MCGRTIPNSGGGGAMVLLNETVGARPKESRFLSCTADGKRLEGKLLQHRFSDEKEACIPFPCFPLAKNYEKNHTEEGYYASLPTDLFDDDDNGEEATAERKQDEKISNTGFFFKDNSMLVSPGNSRTTWTNSVVISTTPTTPVKGAARGSALYGSFAATASTTMMTINSPSNSESINMWQYEEVAVLSPRTTDAVVRRMSPSPVSTGDCWGTGIFSSSSPLSSSQLLKQQQQDDPKRNQWAAMKIPTAPALRNYEDAVLASKPSITVLVNRVAANGLPPFPPLTHHNTSSYEEPSIPATIAFVKRLPPLEFDVDDNVSLLADDPDDDDAQVLPMATYDVLAETGIFADDDDDNEEG